MNYEIIFVIYLLIVCSVLFGIINLIFFIKYKQSSFHKFYQNSFSDAMTSSHIRIIIWSFFLFFMIMDFIILLIFITKYLIAITL